MKTIILGAGAWGTALAVSASRHAIAPRVVTLWARDAQQARDMQLVRENSRYLPGVEFPATLQIRGEAWVDLVPTLAQQDLIVVASPMAALRGMLQHLREIRVPVAWLCKGFESSANSTCGLLGHEIQLQVAPALQVGVLSGPSFAQEVALGRPSALVAASAHVAVCEALVQAFHTATLRVYTSADVIGVEIGGAVKNVLAIATGLCDGLQLGLNARAAVITRGLAEMGRLGLALGAQAQTFMGLSGLGDLVLTATGDLSRNRQVGLALAHGQSLQQALQSLGHVAEGVYCARAVVERAESLNVDMPIARSIVALLDGTMLPAEAVAALMRRDPTAEIDATEKV